MFQFIEFGGCAGNVTIMSITTVMGVIFIVLVFFRTREDASILTSSLVLTYSLYMQWSAMSSQPTSDCNPYEFNPANTDCMIVFGALFTFICLFVIAGSEKDPHSENVAMTANTALLDDEGDA